MTSWLCSRFYFINFICLAFKKHGYRHIQIGILKFLLGIVKLFRNFSNEPIIKRLPKNRFGQYTEKITSSFKLVFLQFQMLVTINRKPELRFNQRGVIDRSKKTTEMYNTKSNKEVESSNFKYCIYKLSSFLSHRGA